MSKQYKVVVTETANYYGTYTISSSREGMLNSMAKDGFELVTTVAIEKRVIDTFVRDDESFAD